jgi:hypothetical protein
MILTIWCIALALSSPVVIGAPLQWLLTGQRPLDSESWKQAPFLGLAAIVLILQNLVYLDCPVAQTAWPLWLTSGALWTYMAWRGQLRTSLRTVPWGLYALAAGAYLLQGTGLVLLGVHDYAGRAWSDQFNYTALAEFFAHWPFSTPLSAAGEVPWLIPGIHLKFDRIGQSILHGFLLVSSGGSPRELFGPTILLGPALTVLSVAVLARRLGLPERWSLPAGAVAGLLPGVALMHLECFLSHALAAPLLLLVPAWLDEWHEQPGLPSLLRLILLVNLVIAIYTELVLILVVLVGLSMVLALVCRACSWRLFTGYAALQLSPLLVNGFFAVDSVRVIALRAPVPGVLAAVYPWAETISGWGRIWLGELAGTTQPRAVVLVRLFTLAVMGLGYLGLLSTWRAALAFRPRALASLVLALAFLPILVILKDSKHPYQMYKLLLTVCPLLVLGLALEGYRIVQGVGSRWTPAALAALVAVGFGFVAFATVQMTSRTGTLIERPRSATHLVLAPDMRQLQGILEASSGQDLVIIHPDPLQNSWLAYFGRHDRVRLAYSEIVDLDLARLPEAAAALSVTPPDSSLFVTRHEGRFQEVRPGELELLWSGVACQLWRARSQRWALPLKIVNPNGLELLGGRPFFWVGGAATRIDVLAGCPGQLTLQATALPGPARPETQERRLSIRHGWESQTCATQGGPLTLVVRVPAGRSTILLEALDSPSVARTANGDPRPLLLGVQDLKMSFAPLCSMAGGQGWDRGRD